MRIVGGKDVSGYSRYNFRINSDYQVIDNFLKVGEQVSFIYYKKNDAGTGGTHVINETARFFFRFRNEDPAAHEFAQRNRSQFIYIFQDCGKSIYGNRMFLHDPECR